MYSEIIRTVEYAKAQGWIRPRQVMEAPVVSPEHVRVACDRLIRPEKETRDLIIRLQTRRRLSLGTRDEREAIRRGAELMAILERDGLEHAVEYQKQHFRKVNQFA